MIKDIAEIYEELGKAFVDLENIVKSFSDSNQVNFDFYK